MARYPKKGSGVGNKEGSVRPKFSAFFTQAEIENLVNDLKEKAKTDSRVALYLADHLFGKPIQPIAGDPENPLEVKITGVDINIRK